jgi:putative redox protein
MISERLTFSGHSGEALAARFDKPSSEIRAVALFAHCFTCTKDIPATRRIAAKLADLGIAVLRFDFTGLGHSEGEFANTHFSSNVEDLLQAARHLTDAGYPPDLLIGHSLGGAAVLKAAPHIPSASAVVTIGAPADPEHVAHNFGASVEEIREAGEAQLELAGRPFTIRKSFLDDISATSLKDAIPKMKKALLVLHAPTDQTVGIENASEIFLAAKHPKSFLTLDKADHLLTNAKDANYAAEVISAWVGNYLPKLADPGLDPVPDNTVRVTDADPSGFRQSVQVGAKHKLTADEPASYGGTDLGPSPYQLVSAGLGACTSMTLRMYARRKEWPLEHVSVDVVHDKIHAEACADCLQSEGKVDQFTRLIRIEGPLDGEQRQRLLEIADKCPVHKTLETRSEIVTKLA